MWEIIDFNNISDFLIKTSYMIPIVSDFDKKFRYSKQYKENLQLSEIQKETLIGVLLGDAYLRRPKSSHNTKLVFDQSNNLHKDYLLHLYEVFEPLTVTSPKMTNRKPDIRTGKVYNSIKFSTLSLPCLNNYYELFYPNGKKIIPDNIDKLLTARSLAYLIMDDGGKSYYGQTIIHTRSYSKFEVELLQKAILINFGLTSRSLRDLILKRLSLIKTRLEEKVKNQSSKT